MALAVAVVRDEAHKMDFFGFLDLAIHAHDIGTRGLVASTGGLRQLGVELLQKVPAAERIAVAGPIAQGVGQRPIGITQVGDSGSRWPCRVPCTLYP